MQIGNAQIQRELAAAFEDGLRQRFGPAWGSLYGEVVRYRAGAVLEAEELRRDLDTSAVPVLEAVVSGKVKPATMLAIRSQMIGAAILGDAAAVTRWATMGADRAQEVGGDWTATAPQWQAVQADPNHFIMYVRQIKFFLMQI